MNKLEYNKQYNKDNYQGFPIRLDRTKEAHIIRALQESGSPKAYITGLIAADLRRKGTTILDSNRAAHDDVNYYPFELLETLRGHVYIVGYCTSADQARDMLVEYVQRQRKNCGRMTIVKRERTMLGSGMVTAGRTL